MIHELMPPVRSEFPTGNHNFVMAFMQSSSRKYDHFYMTQRQHVSWQGRSVSNQTPAGYLLRCINHLLAWAQNSRKPQWTHGRRAVDGGMCGTWSTLCWKLAIPSCFTAQCPSAESLNKKGEGYSRIVECLDWSYTPLSFFHLTILEGFCSNNDRSQSANQELWICWEDIDRVLLVDCCFIRMALRWLRHVSVGTVPGFSGFVPEKGGLWAVLVQEDELQIFV